MTRVPSLAPATLVLGAALFTATAGCKTSALEAPPAADLSIAMTPDASVAIPPDMSTAPPDPPADDGAPDVPTICSGGWQFATPPRFGYEPSFAFAPDGTTHLVYRSSAVPDGGSRGFVRHVSSATLAQAETVAPSDDLADKLVALSVAPDGTPNVWLVDSLHSQILRGRPSAGGWQSLPIIGSGTFSSTGPTSVAGTVDSANHAHVAVVDGAQSLQYWTDAGGSWSSTFAATIPYASVDHIFVDDQGSVHVFAESSTSGNHYVSNSSGSWQSEAIPNDVFAIPSPYEAIDSQRRPHAVYYTSDLNTLYHTQKLATGWTNETLPVTIDHRSYAAALDRTDHLHLIFYTGADDLGSNVTLLYATNVSGSWTTTTIAVPIAQNPYAVSIGVDTNGTPHFGLLWRVPPDIHESHLRFTFVQPC
jgi:hypothetical protein